MRSRRRQRREVGLAALLLLPSLVVFGVFVFYPLGRTFWLGLFRTDPFGLNDTYVGFDQYRDVLTSSAFRNSLRVTVGFALYTVPAGLILGLVLAVLAHQRLRGIVVFRTIFSSTVATSVAVASVMWLFFLNPSVGLVKTTWLGDPERALLAVSITTIWQNLGITFIVMLAGLQAVPDDLLEAADVDGARPVTRFFRVTLPLLSPTVLFAFVMLSIRAFESFGQIDILTEGGPAERTNVLVFAIYRLGFRDFDQGAASAHAVVLFLLILLLTAAQFLFLERRVFYGRR